MSTPEVRKIVEEIKHELKVLKGTTLGWHKVDLCHGYKSRQHIINIELWVCDHCSDYRKYGTTFFFRDEKDATLFTLRWL